jgi:hypothetical protein
MIAFAILAIVLAGVVMADFGSQYWTLTSQTSNEALYKAKRYFEDLRASAKRDFLSATSTPLTRDADTGCLAGSLCYYIQNTVTDISPCSKYAQADVFWQVRGYPTSTASLFTTFADAHSVVTSGGDCSLNWPSGTWATMQSASSTALTATPVAIDALNGAVYVVESGAPFLEVVKGGNKYSYTSPDNSVFNAIDVARNLVNGWTYAYVAVATTTNQLQIIDVTDPTSMFRAGEVTLSGVSSSGSYPAGWRLTFYDRKVYIATRDTSGPEFHVIDVGDPTNPFELGTGTELTTSVYGIQVRDQIINGATRRFAYLATDASELQVYDVTKPDTVPPTLVASCDLPGTQKANSIALLGNRLYLGRDTISGSNDLYVFNATDPTASSFCTPLAAVDVDDDIYSRHVIGIRVSGPYLYVATTNSTNTHGEIQVRSIDPTTNLQILGTRSVPTLIDNGIDFDSDANQLYTLSGGTPTLESFTSIPTP